MVRDTTEDKVDYTGVRFGPMYKRWAVHTTKGRKKYQDPEPGVPNWTLAEGKEEWLRFRESAVRHFEAWLDGETDEDHAAATYFNINGAEYVKDKMSDESLERFHKSLEKLPDVTSEGNPDAEAPTTGSEVSLRQEYHDHVKLYQQAARAGSHATARTPKCGLTSASAIPCNLGAGHAGPHSWQSMDTRRTDGLA